jgi:hypothetical protein
MRFESELPGDMRAVLDKWKVYLNSRRELPED